MSFTKRKLRVIKTSDGSEVYNSGFVSSTALSFTSPYAFANGVQYQILLSLMNEYGLISDEDSGSFVATYSTPDQPDLTVTASPDRIQSIS